ncbi:hypothetical protein BJV78DRAFT_86053 [Lactifluus subvellereus]|nr:hypothetical protein BJV78DRAFT_86053 [Lactifluus subvellereus]
MNSTNIHLNDHSTTEDGSVITSTGYLLRYVEPTRLAAVEPGVAYNSQAGIVTQGAQHHTHSRMMNLFPNRLQPQTSSHGPLGGPSSEYNHVPFNHPSRGLQPVTLDAHSYPVFGQNARLPQDSLGEISAAQDEFWMDPHSASSGSISMFPEQPHQRTTMNGPPSSAPPALRKSSYDRSGLSRSGGGSVAGKAKGDIPSPLSVGATPVRDLPSTFAYTSPPDAGPTRPRSSAFPPLPPSSPTPAPMSRGPAYQALEYGSSNPVPSGWHSVLSSADPSERPVMPPLPQQECAGQGGSASTLRSVRTRFGDVYAEYELCTNRAGGRWVCQCGSTFVRDSDWERHAVHSLSHSAGGGFDCNICDISFTRSDAMFRHRRKKHGGSDTSTKEMNGTKG